MPDNLAFRHASYVKKRRFSPYVAKFRFAKNICFLQNFRKSVDSQFSHYYAASTFGLFFNVFYIVVNVKGRSILYRFEKNIDTILS
jgi:hypothetical protein